MYDAALLFATALGELDRSQDIETAVLSCDSELTWQHGNSLINYMKLVSQGVMFIVHSLYIHCIHCTFDNYKYCCDVSTREWAMGGAS